jgi:hypothetical protein
MRPSASIARRQLLCAPLMQVKAVPGRWAFAGILQNFVWSSTMMDVVMVALAVGFFAVSIAYVYACERL